MFLCGFKKFYMIIRNGASGIAFFGLLAEIPPACQTGMTGDPPRRGNPK